MVPLPRKPGREQQKLNILSEPLVLSIYFIAVVTQRTVPWRRCISKRFGRSCDAFAEIENELETMDENVNMLVDQI